MPKSYILILLNVKHLIHQLGLAHCKKFQKEQINLLTIIASGRAQPRAVVDEYWALPYITWALNILVHQLRFLLFRQRKKSVAVQ